MSDDPMTTATAEMFLRQRDEAVAERDRYREALIACATIAGADVSDGPPTWPDVDVWAIQAVQQLRADTHEDA